MVKLLVMSVESVGDGVSQKDSVIVKVIEWVVT